MTSSDTNSSPQEHPMTEATPLASEQITQEDREAAADLLRRNYVVLGLGGQQDWATQDAKAIQEGKKDSHWLVQAFARHRIAALSASPAPSGQGVSGEVRERNPLSKVAWLTDGQAAPAPSCAPGEVATTVRQTDPAAADYGEHFLTAHVSADGSLVGIDHPCDAVWSDVMRAHVALRDRINERIEAQDGCPFKPRIAPIPKTIDQAAERASVATGLAVSVRRSNADTQSHAPLSFRIHVEAPNGRSWTARAGMNRDECKEALFMLASVASLSSGVGVPKALAEEVLIAFAEGVEWDDDKRKSYTALHQAVYAGGTSLSKLFERCEQVRAAWTVAKQELMYFLVKRNTGALHPEFHDLDVAILALAALSPQGLDAKEGGEAATLIAEKTVLAVENFFARYGGFDRYAEHVRTGTTTGWSQLRSTIWLTAKRLATPSQRLDAATVERCAQVAQECDLYDGDRLINSNTRTTIADAIRALATEPHQHGGKGA